MFLDLEARRGKNGREKIDAAPGLVERTRGGGCERTHMAGADAGRSRKKTGFFCLHFIILFRVEIEVMDRISGLRGKTNGLNMFPNNWA